MERVWLEITKQTISNDQVTVMRLDGKLSLETVNRFLKMMRLEPAPQLVLEMAGVTYLDSAGVGALVQLFVHRSSQQKKLNLAELAPQGKAVLEVAGLLKLIPSFLSVEEAIAKNASIEPAN
ncbi:MAG TPA: STAS domain-containing protein [Terriglobales bacterium]|nr:STAS domain-containing protein [Terriglobales bacterium]